MKTKRLPVKPKVTIEVSHEAWGFVDASKPEPTTPPPFTANMSSARNGPLVWLKLNR